MNNRKIIILLTVFIVINTLIATITGIYSKNGEGSYEFQTIHKQTITTYGIGLYQKMSADVAVQGIAQDYVTLFIALPLLLLALYLNRKGSLKSTLLLAGVLHYFFANLFVLYEYGNL